MINFFLHYYLIFNLITFNEANLYLFRFVNLTLRLDSKSTSFLLILGVVRMRVVLWSFYYIDNESNYARFTGLLIVFLLFIIGLIMFSNLYITLIGWDGLGVRSLLLVLFYKNRKRLGAGMITALTNRVGDCLFFCCLGFIISIEYVIYIFPLMCITKSAQFPFSSWLPSAIAAPTPVRALVHSSTLVTAGVYLLIRYNFEGYFLLWVGAFTLILSGLAAVAERDFKKVVALRTLSQIRTIFVSIGAHEKTLGFFHLISHAWFKALLFICVGMSIHSLYGTQDYRRIKGLRRLSSSVFRIVAVLSLIGFVFTAGFYTKEVILEGLQRNETRMSLILVFLVGIGLTARYSFKILRFLLTPSGERRMSLGAESFSVKMPIWILGLFRTSYGYMVQSNLVLSYGDKLTPIIFTLAGALFYGSISPFLRRLLVTPHTQGIAQYAFDQQKHEGWYSHAYFPDLTKKHYILLLAGGLLFFFII